MSTLQSHVPEIGNVRICHKVAGGAACTFHMCCIRSSQVQCFLKCHRYLKNTVLLHISRQILLWED